MIYGYVRVSSFEQNERENIKIRQRQGIDAAKARGVVFGRPKKKLPENFMELITKWQKGEISLDTVLDICNISKSTLYRKKKELKL